MEAPIRVAVIGLVNERIWTNIEQASALPHVEFVGVADPNPASLQRFADTTGCDAAILYEDVETMLRECAFDAVLGGLLAHEHVALTELCADRGAHLFLEKPMAANLDESDLIVTAVQRSEIRFMVNFPRLWNPAIQRAAAMCRDGAIGDLLELRFRSTRPKREVAVATDFTKWLFSPAFNPTGAFLDQCSYGAQLASWILGEPLSAVAVSATLLWKDLPVDDGTVLVMKYDRTLAIAEGVWTEREEGHLPSLWLHGTAGTLAVAGETLLHYSEGTPNGAAVPLPKVPAHRANGVAHFFHALLHESPIEPPFRLQDVREAQEILEAGMRSIETGFECPLPVR